MKSISMVLLAFLEQRTWRQAELAERVGVQRKTIVRILNALRDEDRRFTRDDKDRPDVYWSVPQCWFPGAVAFSGQDLIELVRLLHRLPHSEKRDSILRQIAKSAPGVLPINAGDRI
jgi:DNA-binding IclR family transcriptional regulator